MKSLSLMLLLLLGACSFISRDGPSTSDVNTPSTNAQGQTDYVVVELDQASAAKVKAYYAAEEPVSFAQLPPARAAGKIGVGDRLGVSIWEANAEQNALFEKNNGAQVKAVVDQAGDITVPYAGRVRVTGLTTTLVEELIAKRLKGKAYAPQVLVQIEENVHNTVFVQGEVGKPGRFALTPGGSHLLDLVALAGGPKLQPHETMIQVRRDNVSVTADLYRIMQDPAMNIALSPGDNVIITRRQDVFYAFGAVNRLGQLTFSAHTNTLLQAMGAIAGVQDQRADPNGLFVFREEPVEMVRELPGIPKDAQLPERVKVAYRVVIDDPNSIFVLNNFPVRPSDIIYVSNAPMREFQKVVESIFGVAGNVLNAGVAATVISNQ